MKLHQSQIFVIVFIFAAFFATAMSGWFPFIPGRLAVDVKQQRAIGVSEIIDPEFVCRVSPCDYVYEEEESGVLRYLISGGDLSKWGLANAITRVASDSVSYDRATEIEAAGGNLLSLTKDEWMEVATAVPSKN